MNAGDDDANVGKGVYVDSGNVGDGDVDGTDNNY